VICTKLGSGEIRLGSLRMKSMISHNDRKGSQFDECFYGSVTVGERGQIVIPSEARTEMGIQQGDKLLIMKHPAHHGLMVFKIDSARAFLDDFAAMLDQAERREEK
jgi:AbrB family looped-hinge helix DNA binding protein